MEHCPSLLVKRSSRHRQPGTCNVSNKNNNNKKPNPEKQTPGHYLIQQIQLDVPYLKFHEQLANWIIHKCMLALLSAQQFQQPQRYELAGCYLAAPAASKPQLCLRSFFSALQPVCYHLHTGWEKKQGGEDQYSQYVYIQQERVVGWGVVMCVSCVICGRILSGSWKNTERSGVSLQWQTFIWWVTIIW